MKISIKAARINAGATKAEIAKLLDVQERQITNIENGTSPIKEAHMKKLLERYGLSIDQLDLIATPVKTYQYKAPDTKKKKEA